MGIKQFIKKYQIILMLSGILVAMVTVKMFYGGKQEAQPVAPASQVIGTQIKPTETRMPTVTIEPEPTVSESDYPLWQSLPYLGEGFTVEKYTDKLTLLIKLKGVDKNIAKKGVETWLIENGWEKDSHKLMFEE
jgi:hypothetical protein